MSEPPSYNEKAVYPPPADHAPKPTAYPPQNVPPPTGHVCTSQPQQPPQPPRQPTQQIQTGATTVVVTQCVNPGTPSVNLTPSMFRTPVSFNCSFCGTQQVSRVSYRRGSAFWVNCVGLCFLIGIFSFIAFCFNEMKDVHHTCPNCDNTVGVNKPQVRCLS